MRALRTLVLAAVTALALLVPASALARPLIIGGSTSVLPLAQKLASAYHKATHQAQPKVTGGQSDIGISGAHEGRFDIGDSSRDPIKGVDPTGLIFTKIARDGVCIVTNKANPISTMAQSTVENIFTGRIRDWSQVTGANDLGADRPVRPRRRVRYPGRLPAHLPGRKPAHLAERDRQDLQRPRAELGRDRQERDRLRVVRVHGGVNPVGYNGVACTLRNARSGQYLGVRNFWMVTKGIPKGANSQIPRMGDQRQTPGERDHQLAVDLDPLS